jgi:Asparaginase
MKERVHGAGGVICICNKTGEPVFHFTTERMAWAIAQNDSLKWGLDPGELNQQSL